MTIGVLKKDQVNIILHGHSPLVSEMVARAAQDPGLVGRAQELGAAGINLTGLCCTGNEVLMRKGIPMAGNHLVQELALVTGAVEAMVVDYQCIMPAVAELASCHHTRFFTTSPQLPSTLAPWHPRSCQSTTRATAATRARARARAAPGPSSRRPAS